MARNVTYETVSTFLPSAKRGESCFSNNSADCMLVEVTPHGDLTEDVLLNEPLKVTATVNQPLLLLGNKPIQVSYSGQRAWEGQ